MVFPCADCSFSCICTVEMGRHELKRDVVFPHNFDKFCGTFIVQDFKSWCQSSILQVRVYDLMSACNLAGSSVFQRIGDDCVGVIIIYDEDIFVAEVGLDRELAGQIGVDFVGVSFVCSRDNGTNVYVCAYGWGWCWDLWFIFC